MTEPEMAGVLAAGLERVNRISGPLIDYEARDTIVKAAAFLRNLAEHYKPDDSVLERDR